MKTRILADTIGRYIGSDKSISAYRLSVLFIMNRRPFQDVSAEIPLFIA